MYQEKTRGWLKHLDFILLDVLSLRFSFFAIAAVLLGIKNVYSYSEIRNLGFVITFINVALIFIENHYSTVMRRGLIKELLVTVLHSIHVFVWSYIYIRWFMPQDMFITSSELLSFTIMLYIVFSYLTRTVTKSIVRHRFHFGRKNSLYIVTSTDKADWIVKHVIKNNNKQYLVKKVFVFDKNYTGSKSINKIDVIADKREAEEYLLENWADEVLFTVGSYDKDFAQKCLTMGISVHQQIDADIDNGNQLLERVGSQLVLTTTIKKMTRLQAIEKRALDILGGIVGCILTAIMYPFVRHAIQKVSPGPVIFAQERVGKNGKHFKMYKFRSMCLNAEEMKESLMEDNRVESNKMFKLDFDPRIIGNQILPDGAKKTGIGEFIRKTSIDEFPQFWNVLKGEMSLVGTRPPTIEEVEQYSPYEKKRLTTKPGITGVWQVSGRSQITDFDKVVKLDTEYIENWNIWLDIKILFMTVVQIFKREGAM